MIKNRPSIVCLCGSTRFGKAFEEANLRETLDGKIVLTIGCSMRSDAELFKDVTPEALIRIKADLDELHKRKIDLADEVLILNVGGYVGKSTFGELIYALQRGKEVRWLEPSKSLSFKEIDARMKAGEAAPKPLLEDRGLPVVHKIPMMPTIKPARAE